MKQEEDFDEIIRQKFAEKEFVFNEENWERAERKIDAARRLKKILLWSTVFITGFSCGIGVTVVVIQKKQMNNSIVLNDMYPKHDLSEFVKSENNVIKEKNNASDNGYSVDNIGNLNEAGNNEKEDNIINNENQKVTTLVKTGIMKEEKSRNMKNEQNWVVNEKNKDKYNKSGISEPIGQKSEKPDKESIGREKIGVAKTNKWNEKSSKYEETSNKAESGQSLPVKTPTVSDTNSENKNMNSEKSNDNTQTDISTVNSLKNDTERAAENNSEEVQQPTGVLDANKISAKVELSSTEKINSVKQDLNSITETQKDTTTYLYKDEATTAVVKDSSSLKSDSVMTANQSNLKGTSVLPGGLSSATFVSLVIGTNAELGWQYEEAIEGRGFNPIAGIEINHYVNHKWMVSCGIQYGSIAYLKASGRQFSKITYGFGSVSVDTIINTTLLHYAVVPVLLEYNLNDKNAVSIGGSVSYLVNTNSKVSIRSTSVGPMSGNGGEIKTISGMESGYYTNAFNKWDASLAIGYRRRMSQRFTASILANWGLVDIKNNTFFSREKFERNSGVKLVLSYSLFDL